MIINLNVKGQYISRDFYEVVADSIDYLYLKISFSLEWETVTKTLMFKNGATEVAVNTPEEDGTYKVPHEVIKPDCFLISCRGDAGNLLITTDSFRINVKASGLINGQTPLTPSPDVYSQMINELLETRNLINQRYNQTDQEILQKFGATDALVRDYFGRIEAMIGDMNIILDDIINEVA